MKLAAPNYYPSFRCIADKCRHSCCIGWEIDIDESTREKYRRVPGEFGARLNASIEDGEVSSFRLGANGRCPMLNQSGLCDLITALGEESLCQICADHPRFRNYFGRLEVELCSTSDSDCLQSPSVTSARPCAERWSRIEIGLGLCCEEAARLILTQETPMQLITLEDDGITAELPEKEAELLALRAELLALMQDDAHPLEERLDSLLDAVDFAIPDRDWAKVYRNLEQLDPAWDAYIESFPPKGSRGRSESPLVATAEAKPLQTALANFCVYLLYRHLPGALEDDDIAGRVAFCVLSTRMLMALCAAKAGCTIADCIEFARMYSAEIEYSEDNIAALLDALWEEA
ncbi:MAG: hypothetical protein E7318_10935 [Clostridiales bacterium]|nr:hypothetical protein [Clostridiales bacterium]